VAERVLTELCHRDNWTVVPINYERLKQKLNYLNGQMHSGHNQIEETNEKES
jgi:hypothetical protein